jgi:general L-amino acid transport system substrate-binding protein
MLGAVVLPLAAVSAAGAATLDDVKARGVVRCGIAPNNPGFAYTDNEGVLRGFDVDLCHVLAAAIFGDKSKVQLQVVEPRDAFTALAAGTFDVLTHRFTDTFNRDNGIGIEFTSTLFYDGQGFMVRKSAGVTKLDGLGGATICVAQGTTTQLNIADYFSAHHLDYKIVTFNGINESMQAYDEGRCDAWSNDRGSLASHQVTLKQPADHIILPETISKEPIGPVVRQSDPPWAHLVNWCWYAIVAAEELGINSANVDDIRKSTSDPQVKRLLGVGDDLGQKLGLSADWAYNAVKQVGNYGEIFENNLGEKSPLHLSRGLNKQWKDGGLLYAPPFR